jgi:hypothetical protein
VQNDALAGRKLNRRGLPAAIQPTALAVASEEPTVGFRLATWAELKEAYAEQREQARRDYLENRPVRRMRSV